MNTDIDRIDPSARMSQAVRACGLVFVSGQVPGDTSLDITGQTQQVVDRINDLLVRAGSDKSRLLSASIWLKSIDDFAAMNAVWERWIDPEHAPARATVQAELALPGFLVEIAVIAAAEG